MINKNFKMPILGSYTILAFERRKNEQSNWY